MTEPQPTLKVDFRVDDSLTEAEAYAHPNAENHVFVTSDTKAVILVNSLGQRKRLVPATLSDENPTATDDVNAGYGVMETWFNTVTQGYFLCLDNTAGSATWIYLSGGFVNDILVGDLDGVNDTFTIPSGAVSTGAVFWDGRLASSDNYTINGDTVTFSTIPDATTTEVSIIGNLQVGSSTSNARAQNSILVSPSGGDYTNPKDAMDFIATQSPGLWDVAIGPGVYPISGTIQGISGVSIRALSALFTVVLVETVADSNMFDMVDSFSINGVTITGVSGAGYAFSHTAPGVGSLHNCVMTECENGIYVNNSSATMTINDIGFTNTTATIEYGILAAAGTVVLDNVRSISGDMGTLLYAIGSSTSIEARNVESFNPDLVTGIHIRNLSECIAYNINISFATDAIVCDGGSTTKITGGTIFDCSQDGLRIDDTGTDTDVTLQSMNIEGNTRWDLNLLSSTSVVSGFGKIPTDMINRVPGASMKMLNITLKEGDEGTDNYGEFHNGTPEVPAESALGGGDSYTRGMLVYTEAINEGPSDWTDVSEAARSASGSTFTFDIGDNSGSIYVASSLSNSTDVLDHPGIKAKIATAAVFGTGSIVFEYYNGSAWVEFNASETEEVRGKFPHAKNYFQRVGGAQLRYDPDLAIDSWTKSDPMGLGTDYYWARYRIASPITTVPIFEQFKLHVPRFEVEGDGYNEYFGTARPIGQLPFFVGQDKALAGNLGNQSLWIDEDIGSGLQENNFTTTGDIIGRSFFMPQDLDTSGKIKMKMVGRPAGTGNTTFTVRIGAVTEGDTLYIADPGAVSTSTTVVVAKDVVAGEATFWDFALDVSTYIAKRDGGQPDVLSMTIEATDLGGGAFAMFAIEAEYTKWCNGGHI